MQHDLLIIGAGSGGLTAAIFASRIGLDVALVDRSADAIGGECLRAGCVPSKALLHKANEAHTAQKAQDIGIRTRGSVDWDRIQAYIDDVQNDIKENESAESLRQHGVSLYYGKASFQDPKTVTVDDKRITADNYVLATGSQPRNPQIPGLESANTYTNESIFSIEEIPGKLVVVGGGPLGCELGQAFNRLGSDVTIIERGEHLLSQEPIQASQMLEEQFADEGITVKLNTSVKSATPSTVRVDSEAENTIEQDGILLATGREVKTDDLALSKAGVTTTNNVPDTDAYLQTSNDNIYCVGDITGSYQFSHAAEHEATTVIKNLVLPYSEQISYEEMPRVTYTKPRVASFGETRSDLDASTYRYDTIPLAFDQSDRAIIEADKGWGEVYVTGREIRGGCVVSDTADSLIQDLLTAQQTGLKTTDMASKLYPYPTKANIVKISLLNQLQDKTPAFVPSLARFAYRYL